MLLTMKDAAGVGFAMLFVRIGQQRLVEIPVLKCGNAHQTFSSKWLW
jgi:hypothetical protein